MKKTLVDCIFIIKFLKLKIIMKKKQTIIALYKIKFKFWKEDAKFIKDMVLLLEQLNEIKCVLDNSGSFRSFLTHPVITTANTGEVMLPNKDR